MAGPQRGKNIYGGCFSFLNIFFCGIDMFYEPSLLRLLWVTDTKLKINYVTLLMLTFSLERLKISRPKASKYNLSFFLSTPVFDMRLVNLRVKAVATILVPLYQICRRSSVCHSKRSHAEHNEIMKRFRKWRKIVSRSKRFMDLKIAIDKLSQIDRTTAIGVKRYADSFWK